MKNKVRFAVLGCGRISDMYLDAVKNAPDAPAICVISRTGMEIKL